MGKKGREAPGCWRHSIPWTGWQLMDWYIDRSSASSTSTSFQTHILPQPLMLLLLWRGVILTSTTNPHTHTLVVWYIQRQISPKPSCTQVYWKTPRSVCSFVHFYQFNWKSLKRALNLWLWICWGERTHFFLRKEKQWGLFWLCPEQLRNLPQSVPLINLPQSVPLHIDMQSGATATH